MPSQPSANPTPITPPRVPFIDARTGLIDRAWYMFFLSLLNAAQTIDSNPDVGPSAESLIASYDEALRALAQYAETLPPPVDYSTEINEIKRSSNTQPSDLTSEVQAQLNDVRQQLQTLPRQELGSLAPLEQDNVPWLTFNTAPSPVPTSVGSMYWDGGTTMGVQATTDVLIRIGESEFVYVKASAAITKGQLCYHTGSVGASGVITAAPTPLALADPNQIVGVAAESIALNGFGLIQISGDLRGFNTTGSSVGETWADGDPLYYNPAYVGSMTKTKPSAPNQKTYIGEVINAATAGSGSMSIRLVPGSVLGGTDSNVQFGTLANGDLIQYNSALQYWTNVPSSTFGTGSVTSVSVVSANGFAGTVANASTTPAITVSTSISGLLYGNGTAIAAATVSSPLAYSAGTLSIPVATSSANGYLSSTDWSTFNAKQPVAAPATKTANFSVAAGEVWLINNKSGSSCTVTLPTASSNTGRVLYFLNYQAQTLVSASSNVVPLAGGSATTAILEAVAGANATLVSDGTNWIMTQYDSNNALQLE
jgi:hypothetical protein